jgi:hypothetical protein
MLCLFALMAKRTQRKDVGAWLGGNRGTVQSRMPSGASDREAQADAGGGQMEQVRAELGLGAYAAGVGAAGAIGAGVAAVKSGKVAKALNAPRGNLAAQRGLLHGTSQKFKPGDVILPASKLSNKPVWNVSNPNVAYATSDQNFALKAANTARFERVTRNKGLISGLLNPRIEKGIPVRESVGDLGAKNYNKLVRSSRARIYEVEPVNPATVKINKVDKIREKQSAEGFVVKKEVYRGPVFDKQFPKAVKKYRGGGKNKK